MVLKMETKILRISLSGKTINIRDFREAKGLMVFKGLMFSSREKSRALLFKINGSIHSFFVLYEFLILWMDENNKVVEWKIVKPFSLYEKSHKKFSKILEIPINRRYFKVVKSIVGERFKNLNKQ